jgi:uncharacterized protein (TIGR01777 family)
MHILITGGTGLVGTSLSQKLLALGHEVTVLSRSARNSPRDGLTFQAWNGAEIPPPHAPLDAIINLAGAGIADGRWTPKFKHEIRQSRLLATKACVRYIQQADPKPQVFISASAVGYYGTKNTRPVTEADKPGQDFLAKTCVEWESATAGADIRTVILRLGVVLANEGGAFPRLLKPFQFYAGGYLGDGKQGFPWVHISDVVDAMVFVLENPQTEGVFNITAPELHTNRSFARVLGGILGVISSIPVPGIAAKLAMGESAMLILEGQQVVPERLLAAGFTFAYPKAEIALRQLLDK